jgi:hypothetical protein
MQVVKQKATEARVGMSEVVFAPMAERRHR